MIAEFAIYPMGKTHYSQTIAKVIGEVKKSGLKYQIGPMGTAIEGEVDRVFHTLQNCLRMVHQESERVIMNISVDNKMGVAGNELESSIASVLSKVPST